MKSMSDLKYHFGVKMRIYPDDRQKKIIDLNCNISRFVYNKMIEINTKLYRLHKTNIYIRQNAIEQENLEKQLRYVKYLKNRYPFMYQRDIDSDNVSHAKRSYKAAWNMFRKVHSAGTPKFKKKGYESKYQTTTHYSSKSKDNISIYSGLPRFEDLNHIKLSKVGTVKVVNQRKDMFAKKTDIRMGTVTITKDICDRYYISLALASDTPFVDAKEKTGMNLGIDLNIENFLTDSNGAMVANPRYYETIHNKLAHAQRKLSRRQLRAKKEHRPLREAKNYQKQRLIVAKIYNKVRAQRSYFLHKLSTALINSHDLVVAENLRSKNMMKNHALAMRIADVGWREFLGKLEYKADLYGKQFLMIDPKNTTQMCSACGHIMGHDDTDKITLDIREWICPKCHTHHIRDWNAAKNILNKGMAQLA